MSDVHNLKIGQALLALNLLPLGGGSGTGRVINQ